MRIKSDVEFVKRECEKHEIWNEGMTMYCGQEVLAYRIDEDGDYECRFADDNFWYYRASCIEGLTTLEKGKKYTIAAGEAPMTFVEESENFAIFEGGFVVKKDGNEFVEVVPKVPGFLKKEWSVEVLPDPGMVRVLCGGFYVAEFTEHGLRHVGNIPKTFGFALDDRDAAKLVK